MKTIYLLMLQGIKSMPKVSLYGVYRGNNDDTSCFIKAIFEGEAFVLDKTTGEKTYLTNDDFVNWEVPYREARNYDIVGNISNLNLGLNDRGSDENSIQEIIIKNKNLTELRYDAECGRTIPTVPTISGNENVSYLQLTLFGNSKPQTGAMYELGTFLRTLNRYNSDNRGKLKLESGFVNYDNISLAEVKNYTLSPL